MNKTATGLFLEKLSEKGKGIDFSTTKQENLSFLNQGQDQGQAMEALEKYWSTAKVSPDLIILVLYCYKKSGIKGDTPKKSEKTIDVRSKEKTLYLKYIETVTKGIKTTFNLDVNETQIVRSFCLAHYAACNLAVLRYSSKLYSTKALGFFKTVSQMVSMINQQMMQVQRDEDSGNWTPADKIISPTSLYVLFDSPNPKTLSLNESEQTVVADLLNDIAKWLKISLVGCTSLQAAATRLNIPFRDKFKPYKKTGDNTYKYIFKVN